MKAEEKIAFCQVDAHLDSNPKIRRAGRNAREVFLFMLRRVAIGCTAGTVPIKYAEPWYLADVLMMTEQDADQGVTAAVTSRLLELDLDNEVVRVVGWSEEWGRKPKSSAERMADKRARDKHNYSESHNGVTRSDDENVTPSQSDESDVREEKRGEEKRERGAEGSLSASPLSRESDRPAPTERAPTRGATLRGTGKVPLPADWSPTEAAALLAQQLGLDLAHEAAQFRRNSQARGHAFADPHAAFEKFLAGSKDIGKIKKVFSKQGRKQKPIRITTVLGDVLEEGPDGELHIVERGAES